MDNDKQQIVTQNDLFTSWESGNRVYIPNQIRAYPRSPLDDLRSHSSCLCKRRQVIDLMAGKARFELPTAGLLRGQHPTVAAPERKETRSWTNEYVRHGTQALLAALEIASGQVVAHVKQRRTSVNFLRFLKDVVEAFPKQELHMVLDNLNIHKNAAAQRWLKRHPRVHFHYTPTHASWVNMVECFFSILRKQGLSHSVHGSKRQLKEFLLNYIARTNENPKPFVWTKGPEKLQRIIEATKEYQATHPRKPRKRRRRTHNTINN
jgi:transposase